MQQDIRSIPAGQSIKSWQPLGAWNIAAIRVDNNSGSWLRIDAANYYVPPYTIGWQRTISPELTSVSISSVPGPGGKLSTQAGTASQVIIYDEPIALSDGVAFVNSPNPTDLRSVLVGGIVANAFPGFTFDLVQPFLGTAIRLYAVTLTYDLSNTFADVGVSAPVQANVFQFGQGIGEAMLEISPASPKDSFYWPAQGRDCAFQTKVQAVVYSLDANMTCAMSALYALV